jgi:Fe2+ or Zn2+ uptake regulation protein
MKTSKKKNEFGLTKKQLLLLEYLKNEANEFGYLKISSEQISRKFNVSSRTIRRYITVFREIRIIEAYTNTNYHAQTGTYHNRYTIVKVHDHDEAVLLHGLYLKKKAEAKTQVTWNHNGSIVSNFDN